jgi:hypothetical protein
MERIGIIKELLDGEKLDIENPSTSIIKFEKGSFLKKYNYDTCIGKIYLTNKRLIILKLVIMEAKNMKIESADQFGGAVGMWFDVPLRYVSSVTTPKGGIFRKLFKRLSQRHEGLQIEYVSPLETEKKGLFGKKTVRDSFKFVFSIDNADLWSMKIQTNVAENRID